MSLQPTLSVLMPVYNEKETLKECLDEVLASQYLTELIVVDDASTDGSDKILASVKDPRVKIIRHVRNRGKGGAIKTALAAATGEYVLIQDADLEYEPSEYEKLIEPVVKKGALVVYGSRFMGNYENMHFTHYFGNKLLTFVTQLLYFHGITDTATCYKLVKRDLLNSLKLRGEGFELEPEITAKLLRKRIKFYEVPITYHGRGFDEGKKITWKDGVRALLTLLKYRFVS